MNKKLQKVLDTPMRTILAVRAAFDYCDCVEDIDQVITRIPSKFGKFKLLRVYKDEHYFVIQNFFEKDEDIHSQVVTHHFYNIKEGKAYD